MNLHQFLCILRARRAVAALILLAVLALAGGWTLLRPPSYVARAALLADVRTDPVGATQVAAMLSPTYLATQIDLAKSDRVAQRAVELLPPDEEPIRQLRELAREKGAPPHWMAATLQRRVEVKPARESNIIHISARGGSPAEAARVANAFAQAYVDTNLALKTEPARRSMEWLERQVQEARTRLETAQARLSGFQQRAAIISGSEQGDFETERLAEISAQLLLAQGQARGGAIEASVEVMQNPVVNNLRGEIARLEAKLQEASAALGANHPKMQQLHAELETLRARMLAESQRAGTAAAVSTQASARRIRELKEQVAAQRQRVLTTSRQRGDLTVLRQEVETAQKTYDTIATSAAQSRLQGMTTQANVLVLGRAPEPLEPSGLSLPQALIVGFGGGSVLALAGALLAELRRRRVRCVEDLEAAAQVPVLAVVSGPPRLPAGLLAMDAPRLSRASPRSLA
jgi:succinoglycan biosynthesis transport protein ExoP